MNRFSHFAAKAGFGPAVIGAIIAVSGSAALAQNPAETRYRALWPLPVAPLQPADTAFATDEIVALIEADPEADSDSPLFSPLRMPSPVPASGTGAVGVSRPVPLGIIRQGLPSQGAAGLAGTERAVGIKLGADILAVSTKVVAPADGASSDARIDWQLARPVSPREPGFIWTVATGGSGGIASRPEQNAGLMIGYRQPAFAHLTLTSQLTMQGNYVFAPGDGAHSAIVPEVRLSADLNALAQLPFDATFDLGLARQMPVLASQYETRGSAMLRIKYSLD